MRGRELVEEACKVSCAFPAEEKSGLTSQLRRAAVCIPANIAEGCGRAHRGDYVHHLSIAKGSLAELETHLLLSVRLGFVPREEIADAWEPAAKSGMILNRLIASLRRWLRPNPKPGTRSPGNGLFAKPLPLTFAQLSPSPSGRPLRE